MPQDPLPQPGSVSPERRGPIGDAVDRPASPGGHATNNSWFETLDRSERYRGFSTVVVEQVKMPDGTVVDREIVDHIDAVAVVALTEADEVILLRQYRQPIRQYLLEIPAGKLDVAGEPPEDAARRELAEEAHHAVAALSPLTTFFNSAGWSTERTHLFLAHNAHPAPPPVGFHAKAEEADMEVVLVPFDEAVALARDGSLSDAKTALGILLADAARSKRQ